MAFTLPKTTDAAFPAVGGLGYVGAADDDNQIAMAAGMFTKRLVAGGKWLWTPVGATNPVPTVDVSGTPELLTSTPLAASGVFTGPVIDRYAGVLVGKVSGAVYTDQTGTLYLDHSKDNVTWEQVTSLPSIVNDLAELPWTAVTRRYARLRYVNGATAQTVFRLWQSLRPKSVTDVELTGSTIPTTQPVPVKMTGDTYQTVLARAVYSTNQTVVLDVPVGARGVIVAAKVWAVTGTTPSLQVNMGIYLNDVEGSSAHPQLQSGAITAAGNVRLFWYPGAAAGEVTAGLNYVNKYAPLPITKRIVVYAFIAGTFAVGEGFDMMIGAYWLF